MSSSTRHKRPKVEDESEGEECTLAVTFNSVGQTFQVPRPQTFEEAIYMIKAYYPQADLKGGVRFFARLKRDDGTDEPRLLNVPGDLWQFLYSRMSSVDVRCCIKTPGPGIPGLAASEYFHVFVQTLTGKKLAIDRLQSRTTVQELKDQIFDADGQPPAQQRLIWNGTQLEDTRTLGQYNVVPGTTMHLVLRLRGDKPVIYLFPPEDLDAVVKLSLVPEWEFDAVYPQTRVQRVGLNAGGGETVQWEVHAKTNGTLVTKETGLKVSYLFWEALTIGPNGPGFSPLPLNVFVPGTSYCRPEDSTVLASDKAAEYLDKVLKLLGLHTEARTSFITYWLPSIMKHHHIALRFVPQAAYEEAATLSVTPKPDVIVRVFMLFSGVREVDLGFWNEALPNDNPEIWNEIVGIGEDAMANAKIFRVLEWGGMEVKK